jgi:hypothetical protein
MSEQDLLRLVHSIPDGQPATLTVTDLSGERRHLQGVYKESRAPSFFFLSPPEQLPGTLDTTKQCSFSSRDKSDGEISLIADILDKISNRSLELVARKPVRAEDLRQFFRVSLRARIIIRFFPENPDSNQQEWQMEGETVDISQSGTLAVLPAECANGNDLDLEIALVNPPKQVFCTGHVIRGKRVKKDRWLVSFHFDKISAADQDAIAKNCFAEQRRQLRDKGETY